MKESKNQFTEKANKIWSLIPHDIRQAVLSNVWCPKCSDMTTIVDFNGTVERNDVILRGFCKKCGSVVVRLIENE